MGERSLMREKVAAQRGGVQKYRTLKLPGGKYMHVAITRDPGPEGGRTVGGTVHTKGSGPHTMNPEMKKAHKTAKLSELSKQRRAQ